MSTRGYLTVIDGKKNILSAAFFPSDAYPSYLGLRVLDAVQTSNFLELINKVNEDYPDEKFMLEGLHRGWYVKGKDNKDEYFHDYAYEFNSEKGELTVFHFGDKALTIHPDQIPLFQFIFEHEDQLYVPLCLDEKTMTLKKDFYHEIRAMIKAGADEKAFQEKIDGSSDLIYMDRGRYVDSWNRDSGSFNKNVHTSSRDTLKFCASESFGKYYLYVQAPFIRAHASRQSFSSAKGVEKAIAEMIRTRSADITATIDFFKHLKHYLDSVKAVFAADDRPLDDRTDDAHNLRLTMLDKLNEMKSSYRLLGDHDQLYEREIKDCVYRHYRLAEKRMVEQEEKPDLSSSLADAALRREEPVSNIEATLKDSMER